MQATKALVYLCFTRFLHPCHSETQPVRWRYFYSHSRKGTHTNNDIASASASSSFSGSVSLMHLWLMSANDYVTLKQLPILGLIGQHTHRGTEWTFIGRGESAFYSLPRGSYESHRTCSAMSRPRPTTNVSWRMATRSGGKNLSPGLGSPAFKLHVQVFQIFADRNRSREFIYP